MRRVETTSTVLLDELAALPQPVPALTHRLMPGALLPTVPLPGTGVELTYPEVGSALFEAWAEVLPDQRFGPLSLAVADAVREVGLDEIRESVATFTDLDTSEFPEVADCQYAAYRLCLAYWYARAASRPMGAGEVAVCLYLTDNGSIQVPEMPATVLSDLGESFASEFTDRRPTGDHTGLYGRLMPDRARRANCFQRARHSPDRVLPLLVRPDRGPLVYGAVPPQPPAATGDRPAREGW